MRASDLTTTSKQRTDAAAGLVQTEGKNAVNTGLVGSADKSASVLKGSAYAGARKGKAGGRQPRSAGARPSGDGPVPPKGTDGRSPDAGGGSLAVIRPRRRAADGTTGGGAGRGGDARGGAAPSPSHRSLRASLARRSRAHVASVAIGTASSKALKDTELEGADDMAFKARSAVIIERRVRRRLAGTDATAKDAPLGDLSEKGYRKARRAAAADPVAVQRKMQATRNVRRSIAVAQEAEATREAAATGKLVSNATVASTAGGSGGVLGAVAGAASQVAPILLAVLLVVLLVSAIVGGDQDESQGMDGMPSWVTYDLVLACLNAHEQYGYPASALLGQMMIENGTSDAGSDLGRLYHNYGGVKYYGQSYGGLVTGGVTMRTTERTPGGNTYTTYASFAVFRDDDAFMQYRCQYLLAQANYTSVPDYQQAIADNDSELFLRALGEGGYYTENPDNYVAAYRSICQAYPLVAQLDSMTAEDFKTAYSGTGQEYQDASSAQRAVVDSARRTPFAGSGLCATWVSNAYASAGIYIRGNACDMFNSWCTSSDRSELKVGMLVATAHSSSSGMGWRYGHVGIYVGDGKVMSNDSAGSSWGAGVNTWDLDRWISTFGFTAVRWGFPPGLSSE